MRNKCIILSIMLLMLLLACQHNEGKELYSFNNVFKEINRIAIPDTVYITDFINTVRYANADTVFLSGYFSRSLFLLDLKEKRFKKIGRIGQGPGEYMAAYDVHFEKNTLYYNDREASEMGIRNLQTGEVTKKAFDCNIYFSKFLKVDSCFYFFRSKDTHYLTDSRGNNYFSCPKIFSRSNIVVRLQNALVRDAESIYFINQYEGNIYCLNLSTKKEITIPVTGLKNVFDWHPLYDEVREGKFFENIERKHTTFSTFNVIILNDREYFLMNTYSRKGKAARLLVLDNKGRVLLNINTEKNYIKAVYGDKMFMYSEESDGNIVFHEYRFNVQVLQTIAGE